MSSYLDSVIARQQQAIAEATQLRQQLASANAKITRVQTRLRIADQTNHGWLRTEDIELAITGENGTEP